MEDELDELQPSGAGLIIPANNPRRLFLAVQTIRERLNYAYLGKQPTLQFGKDWMTSEQRLMMRGSTRGNTIDGFTDAYTMRSTTDGKTTDSEFEAGFISSVPTRGGAHLHPTSFAAIINERRRIPDRGRRNRPPRGGEEVADEQDPTKLALYRLEWDVEPDPDAAEGVPVPDSILTRLRSDEFKTVARRQGWIEDLERFLADPVAVNSVGVVYGGSTPIRWPYPEFAKEDRSFSLEDAVTWGECMWHFSRNNPGRKIHDYDPFMAPPKAWLNEEMERQLAAIFAPYPPSLKRKFDESLQETKDLVGQVEHNHRFGWGKYRHVNYVETTIFDGDSDEVKDEKALNKKNRDWRWWVWGILNLAYYRSFHKYTDQYETSVREERKYYQEKNAPIRTMSAEQLEALWTDSDVALNANKQADDGYLGNFHQMPPTFQYDFWKKSESRARYADERDGAFDGQTEAEKIHAYYLVQKMFTWWEKLPRIDNRGLAHYKWWAHPDHTSDKCNGCHHFDDGGKNDLTVQMWAPAKNKRTRPAWVPADWEYEEETIWHPTRQAMQLLRKILYTHNVGSHLSDIFNDLLLTAADAKDFRAKYGGGGNERILPLHWWWPGAPRSDTLGTRDHTSAAATVYLNSGWVARWFWLGPINDFITTERARPYNGMWLKHHILKEKVSSALSNILMFLHTNRNGSGITQDDLNKALEKISDFDDAIIIPNRFKDWVDTAGDYGAAGAEYPNWPVFDEKDPNIVLHQDTAAHVNFDWFMGGRSLFQPDIADYIIEEFERAFQRWMIPGTTRFQEKYKFFGTLPNGTMIAVDSFRAPDFRKYLLANWTTPQTIATDFYQNQDPIEVVRQLKGIMYTLQGNGVFSGLRKEVNRRLNGLPMLTPVIVDGVVTKRRKPNAFAEARSWSYQFADNQFLRSVTIRARDRGIKFGDITSEVMDGFGQGYGSRQDQMKRIMALYEIPLKNIYFDTWKGILEKHDLMHKAGAEGAADTWDDALTDLAQAVKSRSLNWDFMYEVAQDLRVFGFLKLAVWIEDHIPAESAELDNRWYDHLGTMILHVNPNGGEFFVPEMLTYNLLSVSPDPDRLIKWPDSEERRALYQTVAS